MKTCKPPYPNKFRAGDVAVSKTYVDFMYGEKHYIGQKCVVTEETASYFNVNYEYYDLKAHFEENQIYLIVEQAYKSLWIPHYKNYACLFETNIECVFEDNDYKPYYCMVSFLANVLGIEEKLIMELKIDNRNFMENIEFILKTNKIFNKKVEEDDMNSVINYFVGKTVELAKKSQIQVA